ncbi:hypothetical protein GZH53_05445 [Flavihumibacter sp. R14]|nr:hypothetical protein [Flavihumibacter soli]
MERPTFEEHPNHSSGVQPVELPVTSFSAGDPASNNSIQETKNMEVHHHAHHDHGKKNWKSYFWEFMMLFLAVFCGFLAEYQLEHKIESDREEVYIKSMIEDLQKDTMNLASVIRDFQMLDLKLDTVLKMYPKLSTGYNDTLWRNVEAVGGYPDFIYSDRTMQQLKNSGAMRLIRNKKVTDGIASYDSNVRDLITVDIPGVSIEFMATRELVHKIFDQQNFAIDWKTTSIAQMKKANKNYLLKSDQASLGEFYNSVYSLKHVYQMISGKETLLYKESASLINLLKSQYKLE